MSTTIQLDSSQCESAEHIQGIIDSHQGEVVTVSLPAGTFELDRSLRIYSGMTLSGQGADTVLVKTAGRRYPLTGYHNYGMHDLPMVNTEGLHPGMTITVEDDLRGGFYGTYAVLTWVEDDWVGIDRGIHADYGGDANPALKLTYPLIVGENVSKVCVRDLVLEGNIKENDDSMNGCRGGCLYFIHSQDVHVENVRQYRYNGEGFSFQMCHRVRVLNSEFSYNSGNGMHPGAGSTDVLYENCVADHNGQSGFFFCVRANHITVRNCSFSENANYGISIGTRDSHNLIEGCRLSDNALANVCFRSCPGPTVMHDIALSSNHFAKHQDEAGFCHIKVDTPAHRISITDNACEGEEYPFLDVTEGAHGIFLGETDAVFLMTLAEDGAVIKERPDLKVGCEQAEPVDARHLAPYFVDFE